MRGGVGLRPGRRVGSRGLRQRLRVPRRRGARAARVREEHPVRAVRGRVGRGAGRSGVGRRARGGELRRRQLRRLVRRPADVRSSRSASWTTAACAIASTAAARGRRRCRRGAAASATATRTTPTTPSTAAPCVVPTPATRSRSGSPARRTAAGATTTSPARLHLHGGERQPCRRAGARERGLHRRQPEVPGRHERAEVRADARRRARSGGLQRRPLGRRRAGRAARPRRARPLRRGGLVPRRQPVHAGPGGRAHLDTVRPAARHRRQGGQQYLTMAVRDYLNAGGKLFHGSETAQHSGLPGIGDAVGGLYYGLNGNPDGGVRREPVPGFFEDCLLLADDFRQYYLGAFTRTDTTGRTASPGSTTRSTASRARSVAGRQPARRGGIVPADQRGAAGGRVPAVRERERGGVRGDGQPVRAGRGPAVRRGAARRLLVQRLSKTVTVPEGAQSAELRFQLSINTEPRTTT